jgi:hypothetical protein
MTTFTYEFSEGSANFTSTCTTAASLTMKELDLLLVALADDKGSDEEVDEVEVEVEEAGG